jgi:hypothetical protein
MQRKKSARLRESWTRTLTSPNTSEIEVRSLVGQLAGRSRGRFSRIGFVANYSLHVSVRTRRKHIRNIASSRGSGGDCQPLDVNVPREAVQP